MSDEEHHCAECGAFDGRIQHVDIAWSGGRHIEAWLHPECEQYFAARNERRQPELGPTSSWQNSLK